jgi:hypothetical protein
MSDVLDRLLEHWRLHGVKPAALKANADEIASWEAKHAVRLPDDLREYVTRVNGILSGEQLEFDDNLNTLLPLSAMKPESEVSNREAPSNRFIIADHCISCFWWTVDLDAKRHTETVVSLSGTSDGKLQIVAASMAEFLDMYIANSPTLYGSLGKGPR